MIPHTDRLTWGGKLPLKLWEVLYSHVLGWTRIKQTPVGNALFPKLKGMWKSYETYFFPFIFASIIQIKMPWPDAVPAIYLNVVFICNN